MKKIAAFLLAVMLVVSMAPTAFANTTTLTTTVPAASYTLNIPASQNIDFGETETEIGNVTVTNSSGFAVNKNLEVTVTYGAFESESVETTIPYMLRAYPVGATWVAKTSGSVFTFKGKTDGTVATYAYHLPSTTGADETTIGSVGVYIASSAWGQALAGEYSSTITFTSEVVVE